MSNLPKDLAERLAALGTQRPLLVCSDYDGTLAPIAQRPEQVQLLPGAFNLLHELVRLPDTRVAIISGRSRDNLRAHSGLDLPILLIGSHGAELPGRIAERREPAQQTQIDALESALVQICARAPGAWIERKPFGMAVHVREASCLDGERVLAQVRDGLTQWPAIHATEGKAVIELSFVRTSKGDAVHWLRNDWGVEPQVIYFGDDVTDESAFEALGPEDIGVKVGAGQSRAAHRVTSESEALSALAFLLRRRALMTGDCIAQPVSQGSGI